MFYTFCYCYCTIYSFLCCICSYYYSNFTHTHIYIYLYRNAASRRSLNVSLGNGLGSCLSSPQPGSPWCRHWMKQWPLTSSLTGRCVFLYKRWPHWEGGRVAGQPWRNPQGTRLVMFWSQHVVKLLFQSWKAHDLRLFPAELAGNDCVPRMHHNFVREFRGFFSESKSLGWWLPQVMKVGGKGMEQGRRGSRDEATPDP